MSHRTYECPNPACHKSLKFPANRIGKKARCKSCGATMHVTEHGTVEISQQETQHGSISISPGEWNALADVAPSSNSKNSDDRNSDTGNKEQSIGRFNIQQQLGAGGFGTVYRAYDIVLDREVALKVPHRERVQQAEDAKRFLREAKTAARLTHPNIVQVYDAGHDGETYFIASRFVHGRPLDQVVSEDGPLAPREAAQIVRKLAEAIHYAHSQGIIHRDIKPQNVMLDEAGEPHLMDFGLARLESDQEKLTRDGTLMGTPAYMSPEQASTTRTSEVGPLSDQYSLGALFYELLTGHAPFEGPVEIVLYQVMQEDPEPLRKSNTNVPRDLETICQKAMAKEPARRFANAEHLAEDLDRWLDDRPITARRVGPLERTVRWVKRNPVIGTLTLAVFMVSTIGFAVSSSALSYSWTMKTKAESSAEIAKAKEAESKHASEVAKRSAAESLASAKRARESEATAKLQQKLAEEQQEKAALAAEAAQRESKRARDSEASAKFQLANARWAENRTLEARRLLHNIAPEYRKNFEWQYCTRHFLGSDVTLYGHTKSVNSVAFSPDGKRIVSGGEDDTIRLWDVSTGQELITLHGDAQYVDAVAFSPDGTRIAGSEGSAITLWDAHSGEELFTVPNYKLPQTLELPQISSWAFSPDGTRIAAACGGDLTIKQFDVRTGEEIITFNKTCADSMAFSPDGTRIATQCGDTISLLSARTGAALITLTGDKPWSRGSITFSPDGKSIASVCRFDCQIKLWDARTGEQKIVFKSHIRPVSCLVFSPDGMRIATGSADNTIKLWDARTGQELMTLKGHTDTVRSVAFSPDGTRIASGSSDGTIKLWDARSGEKQVIVRSHTSSVNSVAFSPDGTRIASGSTDNTIRLWEARTGVELTILRGHTKAILSVAFSPDGKRVASGSADNTIKLWDARTGQELITLKGHIDTVRSVAFSPDGTRIASGSSDGTIKLWDARTGEELNTLKGHEDAVYSVTFSPDGTRIASGGEDNTIKLWDARTGEELINFKGRKDAVDTDAVNSVTFSPDGMRIASASYDGTITLRDARTGIEDTNIKPTNQTISPDELAYRQFKSKPDPWWHNEQADLGFKNQDWYAAAFHSGRLLELAPKSQKNRNRFQRAWDKLDAKSRLLLPYRPTAVNE